MDIEHIEKGGRGVFIVRGDGKRLAEMAYKTEGDAAFTIDHTEVDESLRGQKVGDKLLAAAVEHARKNNLKIHATCSFALKKLHGNAEFADVFEEQ